jgi:hypothetical protein
VPLLSAMSPLLAVPRGGGGLVHLQFGTRELASALGNDPELVVSWVPSGAHAVPTPLVRARVAALQAAARARGNPPGLIDVDVELGPRPRHGLFIAQLVDGDALLAARSVALLPASAQAVVAELLRARLPADTMHAVAHDLGVLLCSPRVRTTGGAAVSRSVVLALMASESACRPGLPALRALLDGLLRELDAGDAELEASPGSSSSPVATATDAGIRTSNPIPLLWCWACVIVSCTKAAQHFVHQGGTAALAMALFGLPYALHILAASTRLSVLLPRALRGVDPVPAHRIFIAAVCFLTVATGVNPLPNAPECHLKYAGDLGILLAVAWFERPRSPAVGVALSLGADLPSINLLKRYVLACCGQATSAGQALFDVGLHAALVIAVHVAVWWWAPSPLPPGTRATKLKVA